MKTIIKTGAWKILKLFYENRNAPLHLREIARKSNLNESSISRHLNKLTNEGILKAIKEANLKKFYVNKKQLPGIFPLFDYEKLESLPLLRRDAIKTYINKLKHKPLLIIIFGSTAKGTYKDNSDIDVLIITSSKGTDKEAAKYAESQTGLRIQTFEMTENNFKKELKTKEDKVIQAALETGFPVFNAKYYYDLIYNE